MTMEKITGKVDEMELEALAGETEEVGAGLVATIIIATIGAISIGFCPTGACTKSC